MLIGQTLRLSFAGYLAMPLVPAVARARCRLAPDPLARARDRWASDRGRRARRAPPFDALADGEGPRDRWRCSWSAFLFAPVPREVLALGGAAILLMSRRMASRDMIGLVDWQLLVLFIGLFVVNHALPTPASTARASASLRAAGVDLADRALPVPRHRRAVEPRLERARGDAAAAARDPPARRTGAGARLARSPATCSSSAASRTSSSSTRRRRSACAIGWREHARVGVPVTLVTLAIAAFWLWLRAR